MRRSRQNLTRKITEVAVQQSNNQIVDCSFLQEVHNAWDVEVGKARGLRLLEMNKQ